MTKSIFFAFQLFVTLISLHADEVQKKPTVCLNMIVKNEKDVIERCMTSVLPIIDYWVIVDTGSTDGTQDIIKEFMKKKNVPGELFERPWVNFEHNRNEALECAKGKADYVFFIDADEYLVYEEGFVFPKLDKDYYYVTMNYNGMRYGKIHFVNNHQEWKWIGVLHEVICPPMNATGATLEKVSNTYTTEGARSKDPDKYKKDAAVLEEALKKEPNNSRYVFYLAQSYRDAREFQKAYDSYNKRVLMGGWDQEIFWSLYQMGILLDAMQKPFDEVLKGFQQAHRFRKTRMEPIYCIANLYRRNNRFQEGYDFAKKWINMPEIEELLFHQKWMYEYGLLLELSICAYWTDRFEECQELSLELLKRQLPLDVRACVERNLGFAHAKVLEKQTNPTESFAKK